VPRDQIHCGADVFRHVTAHAPNPAPYMRVFRHVTAHAHRGKGWLSCPGSTRPRARVERRSGSALHQVPSSILKGSPLRIDIGHPNSPHMVR
jgi:hypothetical protein